MDEALVNFACSLPESCRGLLDDSPASLEPLERLFLEKYSSPKQAMEPNQATFLDGAARYFGEVLRRGTGSKWQLRRDDEDFVYYGLPILFGGTIKVMAVCPLTSMTTLLDRRTGRFLSSAYARLTQH